MSSSLPLVWWIAPCSALIALGTAYYLFRHMLTFSEGTPRMQEIAGFIKEGANAYLKQQYGVVSIVFVVIFLFLVYLAFIGVQHPFSPLIFLSGGFWSAICGYLGMKTATNASARTAFACQTSLNQGLHVSFRSGAVMGLVVVGFGLLDISVWFLLLHYFYDNNIWGISATMMNVTSWDPSLVATTAFQHAKLSVITSSLLTYAMGSSVMALFARVGGGIFTKAADVGADLVGKVESNIPEDDPRNPATIADNVGDNVGDVAGMGADLYESYCGSILAAMALGASLILKNPDLGILTALTPMIVAGGGIFFSLIGIFVVRTHEQASQKNLLLSLFLGTGLAAALMLLFTWALAGLGLISWGIFGAIVIGLLSGVLLGQATEYYTSDTFKPTQKIAQSCQEGVATNILSGIAVGMHSTGIPVVVISGTVLGSFWCAGGANDLSQGIYGIAFSAIGMLSTLGIQLATDAFGPIADNAGGNAEMAQLPPHVRQRTDILDAVGNTTAATGKGFALGSAALTALALIASYLDAIKQWLSNLAGQTSFAIKNLIFTNSLADHNPLQHIFAIEQLDLEELVHIFHVNIVNPKFLCGIFLGAMLAFVFAALIISAVHKAATLMVNEVRCQFRNNNGILAGSAKPDYAKCISISTAGALKAMFLPSLLAVLAPIVTGLILHIPGVLGLLLGSLTTGFSLAIALNNAGGAWDNAKKYIEAGHFGGKGSHAHKAAVIGDTVGDPFKDTAGPALNVLIKLMTIVSVVCVGLILKFGLAF